MWRETSTTSPSVSDWPLVPVPPPRGASVTSANCGSCAASGNPDEVVSASRERDCLWRELIDRVVCRQDRAVRVGGGQVSFEASGPQLSQECCIKRHGTRHVDKAGDHGVLSGSNQV